MLMLTGFAFAADAIVLSLAPGVDAPVYLTTHGTALGASEQFWRLPVTGNADAVAASWTTHPDVRSAAPDGIVPLRRQEFDDPELSAQWYRDALDHDAMMAITRGDPSIRVAVIDSAIDLDHPDLADAWVDPFDAMDDDDDPRPIPGDGCDGDPDGLCDSHGTEVAGIIGARADNGIGIAGLCPQCSLIPIRLLGSARGGVTLAQQVAAFEHAIAADAAVINNSWGYGASQAVPGPMLDVLQRARTEPRDGRGALVVFAAGNNSRELVDTELQGLPEVLTVGAYDVYEFQTNYTNSGTPIDLSAPSATVTLSPGGGTTANFGGTSAAAPVVSAIAGWALSIDPSLTADELHQLLIDTSRPITPDGAHDPHLGEGRIAPLALAAALAPVAEETERGCSTAPSALWGLVIPLLLVRIRSRSST